MVNHLVRSNSGMSLVSVMVALGLAGVLTTVIMSNMELQNKSSKNIEWSNEVNNMKRLFQDFVSREEPCVSSFAAALPGEPIPNLELKPGVVYAELNQPFQNSGLVITEMALLTLEEQKQRNLTLTHPDPNGISLSYLKVTVEKPNKQSMMGAGRVTFIVEILARFALDSVEGTGSSRDNAVADWKAKAEFEAERLRVDMAAAGFAPGEVDDVKPMIYTSITDPSMTPADMEAKANDPAIGGKIGAVVAQQTGVIPANWTVLWPLIHATYRISECGNHLSRQ